MIEAIFFTIMIVVVVSVLVVGYFDTNILISIKI